MLEDRLRASVEGMGGVEAGRGFAGVGICLGARAGLTASSTRRQLGNGHLVSALLKTEALSTGDCGLSLTTDYSMGAPRISVFRDRAQFTVSS